MHSTVASPLSSVVVDLYVALAMTTRTVHGRRRPSRYVVSKPIRSAVPSSARSRIVVARSYNHDSTKTGHSRLVPVHPTLAAILAEWKLRGWAEMMGRKPTPDDLIIPSREGAMRSRHHSRNKLLDDLKRLGLRHRRGHDLRRTFITLARADGARADLLQMVTHDQKKDIINIYTSMPWAPLCEEVAKLKVQRREGQLFVLPKAANGDDNPQVDMFEGPDAPAMLTSVGTSVQNATRPDPKKLWDVRPLLKKVLVEAPGIEFA